MVTKIMNVRQMIKNKLKTQKIRFTLEVAESCGIKSTVSKNKQDLKRKNTAKERRNIDEWRQIVDNMREEAG